MKQDVLMLLAPDVTFTHWTVPREDMMAVIAEAQTVEMKLILLEVQSMEEFKMDTAISKRVLSNITLLLSLQDDRKKTLEAFASRLQEKVKEMILPSNYTKLHQNLHTFRSNVLPLWLSQLIAESIPQSCCSDFILWQCFLDKILEKELFIREVDRLPSKARVLSHVEQNAIRYAAGSVIRKLQLKWKSDHDIQECLCVLLQLEEEDCRDSTEQWIETTDRGGLYYITSMMWHMNCSLRLNFLSTSNYHKINKKVYLNYLGLHVQIKIFWVYGPLAQ
ncbi:PREDICTED: uncharacterized protein LOC109586630 [Amphimedon queenslandica]|uniref:Uncharacterized protein n=1 Tax=Amphimedon queenslandica TaxID=400682 RepID=A0A1X7TQJ6_AMPQE|nr:PREDICTED: uncharacterized protein LOC109586630 [Amphimedon queenslandica]|eukprot:XP_019858382.1 PREDICTED: uncharacterized protein LOC109586630 [Amphimedon queenslandica]